MAKQEDSWADAAPFVDDGLPETKPKEHDAYWSSDEETEEEAKEKERQRKKRKFNAFQRLGIEEGKTIVAFANSGFSAALPHRIERLVLDWKNGLIYAFSYLAWYAIDFWDCKIIKARPSATTGSGFLDAYLLNGKLHVVHGNSCVRRFDNEFEGEGEVVFAPNCNPHYIERLNDDTYYSVCVSLERELVLRKTKDLEDQNPPEIKLHWDENKSKKYWEWSYAKYAFVNKTRFVLQDSTTSFCIFNLEGQFQNRIRIPEDDHKQCDNFIGGIKCITDAGNDGEYVVVTSYGRLYIYHIDEDKHRKERRLLANGVREFDSVNVVYAPVGRQLVISTSPQNFLQFVSLQYL